MTRNLDAQLALADTLHASCSSCAVMPRLRACLSHTCPDCGLVVAADTNAAGELIDHDCPSPSSDY